jgi:hypothetical protein
MNATTMECYTSGKYEVSLEQKDFCCAAEAFDFAAVSAKCCAFDQIEKVFDGFAYKVEFDFSELSFCSYSPKVFEFVIASLRLTDSASLKSPPDLLSGFSLLKFISVYRL